MSESQHQRSYESIVHNGQEILPGQSFQPVLGDDWTVTYIGTERG